MTAASENPSLTVVGGRYRLVTRVAGGGMGDVWRARAARLGRDVAVKLLKSHLADDDIFRERFRFEARAAAALNHPSIAAVFDYGEEPDSKDGYTAYLVMEFVEGEPLEQHLRRRNRIDPITTLGIVEQTAAGLQAAVCSTMPRVVIGSMRFLRRRCCSRGSPSTNSMTKYAVYPSFESGSSP